MDNRRRIQHMLTNLIAWNIMPNTGRARMLKLCGVRAEPGVIVSSGCQFAGESYMTLATGSNIGLDCTFHYDAPIHVGPGAVVGTQCCVIAGGHEIGPPEFRCGDLLPEPVTIGAGAWLAARVLVLPGVTVGDGGVIGAGSVVHRDTRPNCLYAGVPAKFIREL